MGRHQKAESVGLLSFLVCALVGGLGMYSYLQFASPFWLLSLRQFMISAAFVAACGVISFIVGYLHRMRTFATKRSWIGSIRRFIEILALSIVYAATLFLVSFMLFGLVHRAIGASLFDEYVSSLVAMFCGVAGYVTFVQAELMDAKTLASLLPFFIVSGVVTASSTTTDPYWFNNNFSQLGDRTTFAASMFNFTLITGGVCIIIISYFALSELIATYRVSTNGKTKLRKIKVGYRIPAFRTRIAILAVLLFLAGIAFIGIGTFRYTPHPILHNVFARGLPCLMAVLLVGLPWFAPQLSKITYVMSDVALLVTAIAGVSWITGHNTLTNVEALACMLFLGWFIVFSRQIAAIEEDRIQRELLKSQTGITNDFELEEAVRSGEQLVFETSLQGPVLNGSKLMDPVLDATEQLLKNPARS
ncbi:ABC transporter permease [Bifidobacterium dolichotidis]|nr:ABC transporter permease [Bifidobacterium dolichotidis]